MTVGQVSGVCTMKNCRMAGVAEAADVAVRRIKAQEYGGPGYVKNLGCMGGIYSD